MNINVNQKKIIKYVSILFLVLFFSGCEVNQNDLSNQNIDSSTKQAENKIIICDGINVIENCEVDGVKYSTYKYYPAVEEVSHFESKITYTEEVTGYCTLCNDGTRSPTCATGRGTCSHHGGVAEWNAPIYNKVPHYEQVKIVDTPAVEARYDKVIKQ